MNFTFYINRKWTSLMSAPLVGGGDASHCVCGSEGFRHT